MIDGPQGGAAPPSVVVVGGLTRWHVPLLRGAMRAFVTRVDALGHGGDIARAAALLGRGASAALIAWLASCIDYLEHAGKGGGRVTFVLPNVGASVEGAGREGTGLAEAAAAALARAGHHGASFAFLPGRLPPELAALSQRAAWRPMLEAVLLGDVIRDAACRIRPYETTPGETEAVLSHCVDRLSDALAKRRPAEAEIRPGLLERILAIATRLGDARDVASLVRMAPSPELLGPLEQCAAQLESNVEVNFTRLLPRVLVTGDLFIHSCAEVEYLLERLGAEVRPAPVFAWLLDRFKDRVDWLGRRLYRRRLCDFREPFRGLLAPASDQAGSHVALEMVVDPTRRIPSAPGTVRIGLDAGEPPAHDREERMRAAVQEATRAAERELEAVVRASGFSWDTLRRLASDRRDWRRPLRALRSPHGPISTAAGFCVRAAEALAREKSMRQEVQWHP